MLKIESLGMNIRRATITDIDGIVEIHCNAFSGFFLASLGMHFLKVYYRCFVCSNETIIIIAEEDGQIHGFSASTKSCKGFNCRLIKNNLLAFGVLFFKLLVTSPRSLIRLVNNLTKKSDDIEDNRDYAELYSIAVGKSTQGKSIGKRLLAYSEEIMKEEGVTRISLTTDFYNNLSVLNFYQSVGYEILYEFMAYPNRKMYRLIKTL